MSFFIIKSFHSIPINVPPCIKASPLYPLSMRLKKSPLSSASSIVQPDGRGSVKQCAKIRSPTCKDCSSSSLSTTRSDRFSCVAVENRVLVVVLGRSWLRWSWGLPLLRAYSIKSWYFYAIAVSLFPQG